MAYVLAEEEVLRLFGQPVLGLQTIDIYRHCHDLLHVWTVGSGADCFSDDYGIRLGRYGYKTVFLVLHWKHPQNVAGRVDSSGIRLYYSPRARRYDPQSIAIGPVQLQMAPGQKSVNKSSVCPANCLRQMFNNATVYIAMLYPHMHEFGRFDSCAELVMTF